jgi:hypothetical protein
MASSREATQGSLSWSGDRLIETQISGGQSRAEEVSGGEVRDAELARQGLRLRALAGPDRAHQEHDQSLVGPSGLAHLIGHRIKPS